MLNLYVPYTSYNVLLSMAIAATYPKDDNFMLLVGSAKNLINTATVLAKIFPSNNIRSFALERANIEESNIRNFFLKKRNLKTLEKEMRQLNSVDRIFYIQEWNVYTTYAVHLAEELTSSVSFSFLDDGIYTYAEVKKNGKTFLEKLADKLLYGEWHTNSNIPGRLRKDSSIYVLFPALLPEIYKDRKQVRVDMGPLIEQIDENILAEETCTCEEVGIEAIVATDFKSSYASTEYRKIITSIIRDCCGKNLKTAIKRHPADYMGLNFTPDECKILELAAYVPIELYYLRFRKSLKKIVGGLSTALLTARAMLPNAEIESVVSRKYLECDENSKAILRLFSQVGVKITLIE